LDPSTKLQHNKHWSEWVKKSQDSQRSLLDE